jgi:hypothetical protein
MPDILIVDHLDLEAWHLVEQRRLAEILVVTPA